jgi:hypothetical protein
MTKRKIIRLDNLVDGSPFILESLKEEFKLMYLVRGGDSTCKVQGFKRTDAGNYSHFLDFFSPATEVIYDKSRSNLPISKDGGISIPKEYSSQLNPEEKEKPQKVKTTNKKVKKMSVETNHTEDEASNSVGRPKKHKIDLPQGQEFTVSEIAKKLGVKNFVVNNEIARIRKEDPSKIRIVGVAQQSKGKPARVFKLI